MQAFALAVAVCSAAGVAAVAIAVVGAVVLPIGAGNQSQPSEQPAPQTPTKRLAAPTTMGAPLKKI